MSERKSAALLFGAAAIALGFSTEASMATVVAGGQVTAVFSDPVYAGYLYNDPTVGARTYLDSSSTAPPYFVNNGNSIQWGGDFTTTVGTNYSTLTFTGASGVPSSSPTTPVGLGTLTFTNGTSAIGTVIFGATITFYLNGVELGADQVLVTTTENTYSGTSLTQPEAQVDADYVNICGNSSNICNTGIQAYENTEGIGGTPFSTPVTAELYGTYDFALTGATYSSGDGVVGYRIAAANAPEASTWAMMIAGFAGLGFAGYRASRKTVSAAA
jgi:hypothetical protein